jgi:hypothetical protein
MASTVPACVIDVGTGWVLTKFLTFHLKMSSVWNENLVLGVLVGGHSKPVSVLSWLYHEGWAEISFFIIKCVWKLLFFYDLDRSFFKLIEKFEFMNYLMIFQMGMKMNEWSTSVIFRHKGWVEISFFYHNFNGSRSKSYLFLSNWERNLNSVFIWCVCKSKR